MAAYTEPAAGERIMSDELDSIIADNDQRRSERNTQRETSRREGEQFADEVAGRQSGRTAEEVQQDRADSEERDRLRKLGVKFSE